MLVRGGLPALPEPEDPMLQDRYPCYLANRPVYTGKELEVTDKYTGAVASGAISSFRSMRSNKVCSFKSVGRFTTKPMAPLALCSHT